MKPVGDHVKLRVLFWDGPPPKVGDALETARGRRYLLVGIKGKRLDCIVMPRDGEFTGRLWRWTWGKRR